MPRGLLYGLAKRSIPSMFNEEARDCRGAIKTLYRLCDDMESTNGKGKAESRAAMEWLLDPKSVVDWGALRSLLLRPWWRRVWTLQEFLISDRRNLRFYCGRESISRHDLEEAVYATWLCKGWDKELLGKEAHEGKFGLFLTSSYKLSVLVRIELTRCFSAGWNRRRTSQWYVERPHEMGLIAMLAYVGDSGVT